MRKTAIVSLLTAGILLAGPATSALAHVCFVANDGAATTGNSQRWFTFSLETAYSEFFGLSGAQLEEALELSEELGIPTSFKTRTDKVMLENAADAALDRTGDGRGIEWFSNSPIVEDLIGVVIAVTS